VISRRREGGREGGGRRAVTILGRERVWLLFFYVLYFRGDFESNSEHRKISRFFCSLILGRVWVV